jgi:YMGG-like Gly-zipper
VRYQRCATSLILPILLAVSGCGSVLSSSSSDPITVDSGTVIAVTLDQNLSSKTATPGDHFDASVATPVVIAGQQVIPAGAEASGTVTVAKSAGRFAGNAELAVVLDSVTVDGKTYEIDTAPFVRASKGRGKRTAIGTGIGAAAGAAIGAIAGGGKGAAIGAGAGAGAGTAGSALTGQRDVAISAETKLGFKLTEPVTIQVDSAS